MNNPHLSPRTIREWIDLIPFDRARKEAIENYDIKFINRTIKNNHIGKYSSLLSAIAEAFEWRSSPQKHEYWDNLWYTIRNMENSVKLKQ